MTLLLRHHRRPHLLILHLVEVREVVLVVLLREGLVLVEGFEVELLGLGGVVVIGRGMIGGGLDGVGGFDDVSVAGVGGDDGLGEQGGCGLLRLGLLLFLLLFLLFFSLLLLIIINFNRVIRHHRLPHPLRLHLIKLIKVILLFLLLLFLLISRHMLHLLQLNISVILRGVLYIDNKSQLLVRGLLVGGVVL